MTLRTYPDACLKSVECPPTVVHPTVDLPKLARQLCRTWRGDRTQLMVSKALGFGSNVVTHWESGRNWCATSVAFRMAELSMPGVVQSLCRWAVSDWTERVSPVSREGVALLLNDLLRERDPGRVAKKIGVSRQTVVRWLRAANEPNLLQFISFLKALGMLPAFLGFIAPSLEGEGGTTTMSRQAREVRMALSLDAYRALPQHDDDWVCRETALRPGEVRRALDELQMLGMIRDSGSHWIRTPLEPPLTRVHRACGSTPERRLQQLMADGRYGERYDLTCLVSERTLQAIRRIVFRASSDIAELLCGPRPPREPADRIVYVTLGELTLREQRPINAS